jgi:hypothetical protein
MEFAIRLIHMPHPLPIKIFRSATRLPLIFPRKVRRPLSPVSRGYRGLNLRLKLVHLHRRLVGTAGCLGGKCTHQPVFFLLPILEKMEAYIIYIYEHNKFPSLGCALSLLYGGRGLYGGLYAYNLLFPRLPNN